MFFNLIKNEDKQAFKDKGVYEKTTFGNVEVYSFVKMKFSAFVGQAENNQQQPLKDLNENLYSLKDFNEEFKKKRYIYYINFEEIKKFLEAMKKRTDENFNEMNKHCHNCMNYNLYEDNNNYIYIHLNKERRQLKFINFLNHIEANYKIFELNNKNFEHKVFDSGFLSLKTLSNLLKAIEMITIRLKGRFDFQYTNVRISEKSLAFMVEYVKRDDEKVKGLFYVKANLDDFKKYNILTNDYETTTDEPIDIINEYGRIANINIIEDSFENETFNECVFDTYYFKQFNFEPVMDVNNVVYDLKIKDGVFKIELKSKEIFGCRVDTETNFKFQLNWLQLFTLLNDFKNGDSKYRRLLVNNNYLKMEVISKSNNVRYSSVMVL